MSHLMLRKDWPGNFRRNVRGDKGEILKELSFTPGEPVELIGDELRAVAGDIGVALVPVEFNEEKKRFVPFDADRVAAIKEKAKKVVEEVAKRRGRPPNPKPADNTKSPDVKPSDSISAPNAPGAAAETSETAAK